MKPVIGIVSKNLTSIKYYNWSWQRINNDIRYAINKNGGIALGILPQTLRKNFNLDNEKDCITLAKNEKLDLIEVINKCDGIILQGGISSHNYEEFIAEYCYKKDIPLLAICDGYNNMIRALGGKIQKIDDLDIHNRPDLTIAHKCTIIDKNSLFYNIMKKELIDVNSIHSYVGTNIPKKLNVVALSDDNQVEVVEGKNKKFYMGIKYHPELLVDTNKSQNEIFKAFIFACKK